MRVGDVIGRLDLLALGSPGGDGAPQGGAVAGAWRGWPVTLSAHLFTAEENPSEQRGDLPLGGQPLRALDLYRPRADGVEIEAGLAESLPDVNGDKDLLGRALGNLISNALDAMPEGGKLAVRTAAAPGVVTVEVEDSGPGLTDDQKTRLFTPYFTTKRGGTGLGLAIVQGIVSDHGGRIQVRSEPGHGTSFTLVLPAA